MKIPFLKICICLIFFVLLCDISSGKRSSGGRSRGKSSGSGGLWTRRKSSSGSGTSSSSSGSSSAAQPPKPVSKSDTAKAKPSAACTSARRNTGSRRRTKTNSSKHGSSSSVPKSKSSTGSDDSSSTQSTSDNKNSEGSDPQKIVDVKPSTPCESARRKTGNRRRTNTNNRKPGGSRSTPSSGDSSSTQSKSGNEKSAGPYSPPKNVDTQPYQPTQKNANIKPSAPVEPPNVRKETTNSQQSQTGWNIPGQEQNNPNTRWNIPASQSNRQQGADNVPSRGSWTPTYQNSGAQRAETPIKKDTSKLQQSSPNQPQPPQPGWNVNGQNNAQGANAGGWKSGYQTQGAPPAYPHHNAAPPSYNGQPSWGAPPAYPGHAPGGYGGFGNSAPGGYGGGGHGYPQTGGYGGYGGYGGHSPQSVGGYNPGYGGMSTAGMGMGRGGFGSAGGFGGGYGGSGGFGGSGGYYPMQQKKSFFSASTIGSVVAGMLVYNMASSLISHGLGTKRPYNVVNYYNQEPNQKVEEIKLPANVLILCEGNATQLCGQGTQSVCTQNGTVLCVATMNQATPCDQGGNAALCVNTTVPCADANDPLCQNSTHKDKLQVDVNIPCFTNLTLDVNLVDKSQTQPNTKYTYCVTTMAIAGPEYNICEDLKDTNDYRSVLNGNPTWFLDNDGFRRNYTIYNHDKPMETNGDINMPVAVLIKCSENAAKICAPGTIPTCTTFNEIMCMASLVDVEECSEKNSTCIKSNLPCPEDTKDSLCQNKTEGAEIVTLDLPCFANITLNAPIPKFNLAEYNGTLPDLTAVSSYTYHFNYCVITLALPGSDFDLCITKEAKEKQDKEQGKS